MKWLFKIIVYCINRNYRWHEGAFWFESMDLGDGTLVKGRWITTIYFYEEGQHPEKEGYCAYMSSEKYDNRVRYLNIFLKHKKQQLNANKANII